MGLWRYLDLAKLLAFLQTQSLYFCRGDQLDDPLEGSYPLKNLSTFGNNVDGYDARDWRKFVAVSCWHKSDIESDAMWRLYTNNKQGVALKTSWRKLEKAIESQAYLTEVKYIDFVNDKAEIYTPTYVFEYKRKAYAHENEVRAIIHHLPVMGFANGLPLNSEPIEGEELSESGLSIDVEFTELIDHIVISPYADSWFSNIIKELVSQYGLPEGVVIESELKVDPVYARI